MVEGIGASSGIAMGKAFVIPTWEWDFPEKLIDVADLAYEFERLYDGIHHSKVEIEQIKQEFVSVLGEEQTQIFDAHLAILEDPIFMSEVQGIMQRQYKAAEVAVKEAIEKFVNMFDLLDDHYMKERALDIKDVGNRLLKHLLGALEETLPPKDQPYILVAKELIPSQMVHLDVSQTMGIVTLMGGKTSHVAIMARAMSVPYVLGLEGKLQTPIQNGDYLIIDGDEGIVYVNPNQEVVEQYEARRESWRAVQEQLQKLAHLPSCTEDGWSMQFAANISSVKELDLVIRNGASGVGLFRTEFLYMDRSTFPQEEEQFVVYREVAERLGEKSVVIRTLDIGGDKHLDYLALPEEENPSLGYRAIRIMLDRTDLFKTQLRAILRASHYGSVKIMYPMISSLEELHKANELLEEAKQELRNADVSFSEDIKVGIMIELPASVMISDLLAQEVDFFSIGTNDLVQYVLAVDRMNEQVAHLYDPFHPAVLRMLKLTVDNAKRFGTNVSVCGELAGDIRALPIWLSLGIKELSMSVQSILKVKNSLLQSRYSDAVGIWDELSKCKSSSAVMDVLGRYLETDLAEETQPPRPASGCL
ncbi:MULTISPECIES: phosphoenolpyruvate--protein phosphotransferase [unclassified Paenibacillus]|uniref:phosphoenolpyruvate--protein phosphotransferase n=1 Tax=unclassified Paenibacillus TaxID=185978 RepID=UPI001AE8EE87|nr:MULTISPECIES: phosphoenolpyruvate--protein phosphotransferase [unclassified Paenibacillus]MBP1156138.1 phosphotransferase system enzyme I (PtsI) [Paenibacillus sp. PvP091]MBP1168476.1 phosphotransferase system enzyme I (PtsI) [Paenibacillus sp. PvR098]MBP2439504.1 phosphotransferase system enzyme I (PtsI) [Paenibacillus sp. PvP052]